MDVLDVVEGKGKGKGNACGGLACPKPSSVGLLHFRLGSRVGWEPRWKCSMDCFVLVPPMKKTTTTVGLDQ